MPVEVNTPDVYAKCWSIGTDANSLIIVSNPLAVTRNVQVSFPLKLPVAGSQSLLASPPPTSVSANGLEVTLGAYGVGIYKMQFIPREDFNRDSKVNLSDFYFFIETYLKCTNPNSSSCQPSSKLL